jgi:hypothetical protein
MDDQQCPRSQSRAGLSQTGRRKNLPVFDDGEAASPAQLLRPNDDAGPVQEDLPLWRAYTGHTVTAVLEVCYPRQQSLIVSCQSQLDQSGKYVTFLRKGKHPWQHSGK